MERENDIFEQPSKVQNMNYLFDEEESSANNTERSETASSQNRPRSASSGNGSAQRRSSAPQNQRRTQTGSRSASERVQRLVTEDTSMRTGSEAAGLQSEFATPYRQPQAKTTRQVSDRDHVQASRPRQANPRRVRTENAQQPRQARTSQASPRQANPRQANPSQANPKQANPRQANPRQVNPEAAQQRRSSQQRSTASAGGRAYDDSRRVNRSGASNSSRYTKKKKGKKRSSGFKKFLLIYSAILLVILIVGTIVFSSFLRSLENSQPTHIAAETAEKLSAENASAFLKSNSTLINSFGEPDDMIAQFVQNMEGKGAASYIENKDYRADAPSYDILVDGTPVAKVTLEKSGSGPFGLSNWKIASIDIADYMDTMTYEVQAPVGSTVKINDVALDDKYKNGEPGVPEILTNAAKYVTIPSYQSYKVAGLTGDPQITAKDSAGSDLAITKTQDKFVVGSATTQEFIDSVQPVVEGALDAWGRHFINMGGNLSAYMIEGSDWYSYIFGGPDMDPIMTSFYEFESIANYEFTEKSISNYIKYTDDCFTVDVYYKMRVDFNTDQMSDDNQQLDATWVFITQNGGTDWYIVDCIYK